jgi:hypothetical protein
VIEQQQDCVSGINEGFAPAWCVFDAIVNRVLAVGFEERLVLIVHSILLFGLLVFVLFTGLNHRFRLAVAL